MFTLIADDGRSGGQRGRILRQVGSMRLHTLSIRTRLIGAFTLLSLVVLGLGGTAYTAARTINGHLERVQADWLPSVAASGEINTWVARYAIATFRQVSAEDTEQRQKMERLVTERGIKIDALITAYETLVSSQEEKALYEGLKVHWTTYRVETTPVLALTAEGQSAKALHLLEGKLTDLQLKVSSDAEALAAMNLRGAAQSKREGQAAFDTTEHVVVAITGVAVGLALLLAVLIVRGVSGGIASIVRPMRALVSGDLATAVPHQGERTEIGTIADAVQKFKDGLIRMRALEEETAQARLAAEEQRKAGMRQMADAFEQAVGGIVGMVSSSATELQATAQQMTSTAAETASQSTTVAAAAEEAASNVNTVAVAAEELGSSVQEIGRQVSGSATLAQAAVGEADQTAHLVEDLSQAVARIGDVVGLISDIAGQTNLLALNATIEAARAGEAGRGFAVVAAEVKELASQTAKATEEIGGQIARIQASTGQAVSAISGITARIREINTVATSIAAAVEEQGAATQEIVRNVSQAATGTGEVTQNIAGVAGAAEETGAAASQVLASASELSRQSEHLNAEVARFLHTVRAA